MDTHGETFKEEAYELLSKLESALLELEEIPDDADLIGCVFRYMHTIKGSGAMFGFDDIAAFTHEIETLLDLVRNGEVPVTKELVNLILSACDQIHSMLDAYDSSEPADERKTSEIITSLKKFIPGISKKDDSPAADSPTPAHTNENLAVLEESATYRIRFRPDCDILKNGTNPILLLNELRQLGICKVVAHTDTVPELEDFDPCSCYTYWDVILTTRQGSNAIKDVFIFVEDQCELKIEVIYEGEELDEESGYKKLGEILMERGDVNQEEIKRILGSQKRLGEMLVDAGLVDYAHIESALLEQQHIKELKRKRHNIKTVSSIRVSSDKLDNLVDLVGELVIAQSRLSQTAVEQKDPALLSIAEEVERLTGELRATAMSIRMVPIGTTFSKFRRLVRDLSNELGREVEMTTDGAETELDKTVIEQLNDPLVHLIRNSIDHGIEQPEIRESSGKSRQGKINLSAIHSGSNVLIQIRDDGAGLDPEAIRLKAIENGVISGDAELSEKELFSLIFAPGFSTANKVTNISGRGVGMDVVKKSIDSLRGTIDIISRKGVGTTITLKLPLTMAIIEGLQVEIEDACFVMPLSVVEECIELTREDISRSHGRYIINVRGEAVPYIRLREWFMINGDIPLIEQIVITENDGHRVGLVVDRIIGENQTVIKTLGKFYHNVNGISGATIQGDGTVALILDIPELVHTVEMEEVASC